MRVCQRLVVFMVALGGLHSHSFAGEIEPRAYVNTPVGVNFMLLGYTHSDGGLSTPASSPIQNASLEMDTEVIAYARALDVMGHAAKIDVIVPYTHLAGDALVNGQMKEREINGLHDPRFRFSYLFYGAPAMSLNEFRSYQQDFIIGGSIQISAPVGQYDSGRLVNLGSNRWFIRPDIGISKAWGAFAAELSTGVYLFTHNDDFFGGQHQEQDPLYSSQFHLTYNFSNGLWFALSGNYDQGGRTKVNGVSNRDEQDNSRIGLTLAIPLNKNNSIKLYASNGLSTSTGGDYDLVGAVWQYRWGGGL